MNLNLTILGQMITFAIFIWFTMKFVWPVLIKAMEERQQKIADGLSAAEQGVKELELAHYQSEAMRTEAKAEAASIIEQANTRANHMIEEAKTIARVEGSRLVELAKEDIQKEYTQAKELLIAQVGQLAIDGAQKVLQNELSSNLDLNHAIISDTVGEV
ncbi:MAG: F0F1 ATP synthase subunit B [Coxiellaceae bacterium]|nr:F0F1 ATP synthase subunit B [Coxiellaceae bacterium]